MYMRATHSVTQSDALLQTTHALPTVASHDTVPPPIVLSPRGPRVAAIFSGSESTSLHRDDRPEDARALGHAPSEPSVSF